MIRERHLFDLLARDIAALIAGEILAIRIRYCFSKETAQSMVNSLRDVPHRNYRYANRSGEMAMSNTQCVGMPLNELYSALQTTDREQVIKEYLQQGKQIRQHLREACENSVLPLDALRSVLDETWPWGGHLLTLGDLRGSPGVIRLMLEKDYGDCEEPPHTDRLPPYVQELAAQLSAIAYLQMPGSGGELELWPSSAENIRTLIEARNSFRDQRGPGTVITPDVGDIVIINTGAPHAVRPFSKGVRVVQNMFIGFAGESPLLFWA
ncbi:2OG-Fe(II) oxygenase [Rhizobium leguminosarum]|uniref:2OG-Fe(II) oxygenase n=1 Tax=Rhizobium leguminosarum TaxID=384 RepID=UPI001C975D92|nr:2OG-Fe(II) oxygenase [Rhizobium leguminosarum]MBY5426993.1 2OG-Fe(II) oxygenase [Rhizobium leguminosarum]